MKGVGSMDIQQKWVWLLCGIILGFSVLAWFRSGRPFRAMLLSVVTGTAGLGALYLLRQLCGVGLPVNEMTIGVSAVGGVPGVILLLMTQLILR